MYSKCLLMDDQRISRVDRQTHLPADSVIVHLTASVPDLSGKVQRKKIVA